VITLPAAAAARIQSHVAGEEGPSGGIYDWARALGGIALHGTIGAVWFLRPDGTFWQFEELGDPISPLPSQLETGALVLGSKRHPWISALLPARSVNAVSCHACNGIGYWEPGFFCGACGGLGWL
jgi:hypothetical protein